MSQSALGGTAVLLAAAALVTGCGSSQTPAKAQPSKDTPGTTSLTSSAPLQPAPMGSNACTDAKSDATTNDLISVALKRDGEYLDVTWTMVKRDTGTGTAGFYLNVASEAGNAGGQLGVKYLDGRQVAYFTFLGTNKKISGSAQVTANSVTASFPMSELEQVGPNFKWQGATIRDGNDMDACPGVGSVHTQRFAG
jgi:hypothetical protein